MDAPKTAAMIILAMSVGVAGTAHGADGSRQATDGSRYSERTRKDQWERGKQELTKALPAGEERDFYRKELEKLGYQITSVNHDKPDYMEYEVVKGSESYEIQVDLDKNGRKAAKVEVSSNMWANQTTDQVLKGKQANKKDVTRKDNTRFSDRDRKDSWEKGKETLAQALKRGEDRDFYRRQLEKLGYRITSVNSDKADYVEYEVVKGNNTYEVQVEIDKSSHKATKVDVDTNMWKAEGTERALAKSQPQKKS
jgi:uncharacterized protein YmfQ (DUF2313 family)